MILRSFTLLFFIIFSLSSVGCAQRRVNPNSATSPPGPEEVGPPLPPGEQKNEEMVGPPLPPAEEGQANSIGVELLREPYVLVFGPGLARGLAFIGVIRELEERKADIRGIVGVEIGAMIGAIWASSNLNALEWEMHKFKRETLLDFPLFRNRNAGAEGKKLYRFLEGAIRASDLSRMRIPVYVSSSISDEAGEVIFEGAGSAKDIIRGSMAIPGVLSRYEWLGKNRISSGIERPFSVQNAKNLGTGKVLCVDVLGSGNDFSAKEPLDEQLAAIMKSSSILAKEQLKECDQVIRVNTQGISYLAFQSKADIIFRGREAVKKWLQGQAGNP